MFHYFYIQGGVVIKNQKLKVEIQKWNLSVTPQKLKVESDIRSFVWTDLPRTNILPRRMFREQNKAKVNFDGIFMIFTI